MSERLRDSLAEMVSEVGATPRPVEEVIKTGERKRWTRGGGHLVVGAGAMVVIVFLVAVLAGGPDQATTHREGVTLLVATHGATGFEDALIRGPLVVLEGGCVGVEIWDGGSRLRAYPLVWPVGTHFEPGEPLAIRYRGERWEIGDSFEAGGGYHEYRGAGAAMPEVPQECLTTDSEVAVIGEVRDQAGTGVPIEITLLDGSRRQLLQMNGLDLGSMRPVGHIFLGMAGGEFEGCGLSLTSRRDREGVWGGGTPVRTLDSPFGHTAGIWEVTDTVRYAFVIQEGGWYLFHGFSVPPYDYDAPPSAELPCPPSISQVWADSLEVVIDESGFPYLKLHPPADYLEGHANGGPSLAFYGGGDYRNSIEIRAVPCDPVDDFEGEVGDGWWKTYCLDPETRVYLHETEDFVDFVAASLRLAPSN